MKAVANGLEQFGKLMERLELREFFNHIVGRVEQESRICCTEHRGVVVGVSSSHDSVVQAFECLHRVTLLVNLA